MAALNLFNINEQYEVELDKEWIGLIPEFAAVLKADKGSKGDSDGRKKLKARKQFAYIYFLEDPRSPIFEWDMEKKPAEALNFTGLTKEDITSVVDAAHAVYVKLLSEASRSLRTYKSALQSLDKLDEYYRDIDFKAKDKKGELVHDPSKYLMNLQRLRLGYEALDAFRDRVMAEIRSSGKIRGNSSLGFYEGKPDMKRSMLKESNAVIPSTPVIEDLEIGDETTIAGVDRSNQMRSMKQLGAILKDVIPRSTAKDINEEE